jgi:hypothetical protein
MACLDLAAPALHAFVGPPTLDRGSGHGPVGRTVHPLAEPTAPHPQRHSLFRSGGHGGPPGRMPVEKLTLVSIPEMRYN